MERPRASGWQVAVLVATAIAGVAIAVYLTLTHAGAVPLVCTIGSVVNCASVTHSSYSLIPGTSFPISILGIVWFIVSGVLVLRGPRAVHLAWTALGLVVVIYLVYIEIVVLHQICEWCTVVHLLILASFVLALRRLQQA